SFPATAVTVAVLLISSSRSTAQTVAAPPNQDWAEVLKLVDAASAALQQERAHPFDQSFHQRRVEAFAREAVALVNYVQKHPSETTVTLLRLQYRNAVALELSEQWESAQQVYEACERSIAYHEPSAQFDDERGKQRIDALVPKRLASVR